MVSLVPQWVAREQLIDKQTQKGASMAKYRIWLQREPFQRSDPFTITVQAQDEADAYLTAYDHFTKCGTAINTAEVYQNTHKRFADEFRRKISDSGLPYNGYPAVTHITRVELVPDVIYGTGRVLAH